MKINIGNYKDHKAKRERTIQVKIEKWDTWNMDSTLAYIILPMLKQLKKTKHGSPLSDDEDVPENLRSTIAKPKENEWDTDEFLHMRWDWIMSEMIWAFEQVNSDWEDQFYSGKMDVRFQALDKDHKPIGKPQKLGNRKKVEGAVYFEQKHGSKHTHKCDTVGKQKHWDRMLNGFRLFGKYYMNLWD